MLNEDYKDMLCALLDQEVRFLLVGAYAMAAHGYPRATGDIDIWVEPSTDNAARVYRALAAFGSPMQELDDATFTKRGVVFQIGVEPRRIDIISAVSGVEFEDAYPKRQIVDLEGLAIPVISLTDLVRNKRASDRDKDRIDVKRLDRGEK